MDWQFALNFLIALTAIVNPIGKVPVWVEAAGGDTREVRWRLAVLTTLTGAVILLLFLLFGRPILNLFSIDLPSFKVGGGIVILLTGIRMLDGVAIQVDHEDDDPERSAFSAAKTRFRQIVVPMVVPFIAGPGSISTVLIYGMRLQGIDNYLLGTLVLLLVMGGNLGVLLAGKKISNLLGELTMSVFTRIFGLILAAIAAQLILEGLGEAFPTWVGNGSSLSNDLKGKGS